MRIAGVLQARLASQRLPLKVLSDLDGRPMVIRVWERMVRASTLDWAVVAVPDGPGDEPLRACLENASIPHCAGAETDLIDRLYKTARQYEVDAIVRITADCPCVSWELIDACVELYRATGASYVSNVDPPTFWDGLDVEVYSAELLEWLWSRTCGQEREWFPMVVWGNREIRRVSIVSSGEALQARLTVDYQEDLDLVREIYGLLGSLFDLAALRRLLRYRPELVEINRQHMDTQPRGGMASHD